MYTSHSDHISPSVQADNREVKLVEDYIEETYSVLVVNIRNQY